MYGNTLAGAVFLTAYLLTVEGVCNVPSNYLPTSLSAISQAFDGDTVYIYTDTFECCSGRVTAFSVCYLAVQIPNTMTIVIVDEDGTIVHVHNFTGPTYDDQNTDCTDYFLCCTHQTLSLSEQFMVQSNHHYGIWSTAQLAVHPTLRVPGHYVTYELTPLEVGVNINTTIHNIQRTHFHFDITPGNCESVVSSQPIITNYQSTFSTPTVNTHTTTTNGPLSTTTTNGPSSTTTTNGPLSTTTTNGPSSTTTTNGPSSTSTSVSGCYSSLLLTTNGNTSPSSTHSVNTEPSYTSSVSPSNLPTIPTTTTLKVNLTDVQTGATTSLIVGVCGSIGVLALAVLFVTLGLLLKSRAKRSKSVKKTEFEPQSGEGDVVNEQQLLSKLIEIEPNASYACSSLTGTTDDIYSYVPNEEEHMQTWTSSVLIPTCSNEAYTSATVQQKGPTDSSSHDGGVAPPGTSEYVVNSLECTEPRKCHRSFPESDYEVDQLVYDTVEEKSNDSRPDVKDNELMINEAYVIANRVASTQTGSVCGAFPLCSEGNSSTTNN